MLESIKGNGLSTGGVCDGGDTIKMGDYVILTTLLGKKLSRLAKVETGDVYLKKERINLKTLVGSKFDAIYRLDRGNRTLENAGLSQEQLRDILSDLSSIITELNPDDDSKDNRLIMDDGLAQKLERDEIEAMKAEGTSGDDIIRTLVQNSSTFKDRNVFSQTKYLKKKQAKYTNLIRVLRPTPALLTEMYYLQGPMKINNLRLDSLSQMLTQSNVRSGGKYMVIDTNMGILTASILDRLVGDGSLLNSSPEGTDFGQCVQIFLEDAPVSSWRQSVDALNLPQSVHEKCLSAISIKKLHQWEFGTDDEKEAIERTDSAENEVPTSDTVNYDEIDSNESRKRQKLDERTKRRATRRREEERAFNALKTREMDGLLIVTRSYDPTDLLTFLYRFLATSQPFAVFSLSIDPLLSCYSSLKGCAINSRISETWYRRYQVLDSRTRPEMNMSGSGGYILTGIKAG